MLLSLWNIFLCLNNEISYTMGISVFYSLQINSGTQICKLFVYWWINMVSIQSVVSVTCFTSWSLGFSLALYIQLCTCCHYVVNKNFVVGFFVIKWLWYILVLSCPVFNCYLWSEISTDENVGNFLSLLSGICFFIYVSCFVYCVVNLSCFKVHVCYYCRLCSNN